MAEQIAQLLSTYIARYPNINWPRCVLTSIKLSTTGAEQEVAVSKDERRLNN